MKTFINWIKMAAFLSALAMVSTGQAQILHEDFDPDLSMEAKVGTYSDPDKGIRLDLDQDGQEDCYISYLNYPGFGIWNINFNQIDSANYKVEFVYNNDIPPSQIGPNYLRNIADGGVISSDETFWNNHYPVISDIYNPNIHGMGPVYLGFRLVKGGGQFQYGWIALDISGSSDFTIKVTEYALQRTLDKAITAGERSAPALGLNAFADHSASARVYPNPSTGKVHFELNELNGEGQADLYDLSGQLIYKETLKQPNGTLNLESIPQGSYLLRVSDSRGVRLQTRLFLQD